MLSYPTPPEGGGLYVIYLSDTHYYGGRAVDFAGRWRRHLRDLEGGGHNPYMQNVFNLHGRFDPIVLAVLATIKEQVVAEQRWLDEHFGGTGCVNLSPHATINGLRLSPESQAKRAVTWAKRYGNLPSGEKLNLSDAERDRRRQAVVIIQTPEARAKVAETLTGRTLPPEHCRAISKGNKGKPRPYMSEVAKRSNRARKGEKRSQEVRENLSKHFSGIVWMNKAGIEKRVHAEGIPELLSGGWVRGRKPVSEEHRNRLGAASRGTVWICHPQKKPKKIPQTDLPLYPAWRRGRRWRS
jgi:hypothetical protein